jgi:hypothetical protein
MLNELRNHAYWARVDYSSTASNAAWAALAAQAAITSQGPGIGQADAVQMAAEFAATRDLVANWQCRTIAEVTTPAGKPVAIWKAYGVTEAFQIMDGINQRGNVGMFIVGDGPLLQYGPGGFSGPNDTSTTDANAAQILASISPKWGQKLALALDQVLAQIAIAPQGAAPPATASEIVLPVVATTAIIVSGVAIAIIGSVAAWRYLDPDLRASALLIRQAAADYAERLGVYAQTGTMPPASDIEKQAAPTVQSMSSSRSKTDWLWGGAVVGGIAGGFLLAAAIGSSGKRDVRREMSAR